MIPPMTTPYISSPAPPPVQSSASIDRQKQRPSSKPISPRGYSQGMITFFAYLPLFL
jgi:hypothetical protein